MTPLMWMLGRGDRHLIPSRRLTDPQIVGNDAVDITEIIIMGLRGQGSNFNHLRISIEQTRLYTL
jgi:hypothetical protein